MKGKQRGKKRPPFAVAADVHASQRACEEPHEAVQLMKAEQQGTTLTV